MSAFNPTIVEIRTTMRRMGFAVAEKEIRDHQISNPSAALADWRAYQVRYVQALAEGRAVNPTGVIT